MENKFTNREFIGYNIFAGRAREKQTTKTGKNTMNYNKMKKDDLIEHIKFLKQDSRLVHLAKFQKDNETLSNRVRELAYDRLELAKEIQSLKEENGSLLDCHNVATKEIESLNNRLKKHRRSTKRRMTRLKNYHESKQSAVESLFRLYSTVLLENNWDDRIEWKNDLLQQIQLLIQDLS